MAIDALHRRFELVSWKHSYVFWIFRDPALLHSHFLKHCVMGGGRYTDIKQEWWQVHAGDEVIESEKTKAKLMDFRCPVSTSKEPHNWDIQNNPCGLCVKRDKCFDTMRTEIDAYVRIAKSCIEDCFHETTVRHVHFEKHIDGSPDRIISLSDGCIKVIAMAMGKNEFNVQTCFSLLTHFDSQRTGKLMENSRLLRFHECRRNLKIQWAGKSVESWCTEERWCPKW